MKANQLGMYERPSIQGTSWEHNGKWIDAAGAGSQTAWMAFPNGITAVIVANSRRDFNDAPENIIRNAFDASW